MPWKEYRYVWFAEQYGWTPDQVDSLPVSVSNWAMPISGALARERRRREDAEFERQRLQNGNN